MVPMRHLASACLVALCLASPVLAADPVVDTHRAAAEACVQALGGEELLQGAVDAMMGSLMAQNPDLEPFSDVIQGWFRQVMPWSVMGPKYADLYEEAFTEAELGEMTAFYGSPTGRKYIAAIPGLMQSAGEFSNQLVMGRAQELQDIIMKRAAELDKQGAAPAAPDSSED